MAQATVKAGPSLTLNRRYGAPREAVFRAFTDAQVLKQWFAPGDDFPCRKSKRMCASAGAIAS